MMTIKPSNLATNALAAIVTFTGLGVAFTSAPAHAQTNEVCVTEQNVHQCGYQLPNGSAQVNGSLKSTGQWLFNINIMCVDKGPTYDWMWQGRYSTDMGVTKADMDQYAENYCAGFLGV